MNNLVNAATAALLHCVGTIIWVTGAAGWTRESSLMECVCVCVGLLGYFFPQILVVCVH